MSDEPWIEINSVPVSVWRNFFWGQGKAKRGVAAEIWAARTHVGELGLGCYTFCEGKHIDRCGKVMACRDRCGFTFPCRPRDGPPADNRIELMGPGEQEKGKKGKEQQG